MKYAIVLPDGAADEPLDELGGRTPLQVARIPHMDWIAAGGRLGRVLTIPEGFTPGTDVATLTLLGYDPREYYSGRAPIEAAARGLQVGADELIFRCNFVTIRDGRMCDFTAGHIEQAEADRLIADLNALAAGGDPSLRGCRFYAGVSYRNLMVASDGAGLELRCAPPHDIPNAPVREHLPRGRGEERVRGIMARAAALLREHDVNRARQAAGREPVTDIWLWGQGRPRPLPSLAARYGLRGAVITAVDIIRGLARAAGLDLIEVPGATGYLDTNYAGKGVHAARALEDYDLIIVHVEAPDEAAHQGSAAEKIAALERTDEHVVGPLLDALQRRREWRILVAPDHVTSTRTTQHGAAPPPFAYAGHDVTPVERRPFSEADALAGGRLVAPGHALLTEFFARG